MLLPHPIGFKSGGLTSTSPPYTSFCTSTLLLQECILSDKPRSTVSLGRYKVDVHRWELGLVVCSHKQKDAHLPASPELTFLKMCEQHVQNRREDPWLQTTDDCAELQLPSEAQPVPAVTRCVALLCYGRSKHSGAHYVRTWKI